MAKLPDRINNDAEYIETLDRLTKGAVMIEDPLSTPEERERYLQGFNHLEKLVIDYQIRMREEGRVYEYCPKCGSIVVEKQSKAQCANKNCG